MDNSSAYVLTDLGITGLVREPESREVRGVASSARRLEQHGSV
jgi:hypothetical protein